MVRGQANHSPAFDDTPQAIRKRLRRRSRKLNSSTEPPQTPGVGAEPAKTAERSTTDPDPEEALLQSTDGVFAPITQRVPAFQEVMQRYQHQLSKLKPYQKYWRWPTICIGSLGLFGGISLSAYIWLAGLPPLPDCKTTTPLSPDSYRLYCAQEMARSGRLEDLVAGIQLVKNWSPQHPLYKDSQESLTKWSKRVLLVAQDRMNQSDYEGARAAIQQIPTSSPVYAEAQETLIRWQEQWQKGQDIYTKAQEAMQRQEWGVAFDYVSELGYLDHDYWRLQQADGLAREILVQKKSQEALKHAKKLAKKLAPEHMGQAIVVLQEVDPSSDAWPETQQLLTTWSTDLLKMALRYWQAGNADMAMELAQQVPLNLALPSESQDLVKFSHAYELVKDSRVEAKLALKQVWALIEATTAVQQIQPSSPIYTEAQNRLTEWQAELEDLKQLQMASWLADLGQKPTLESAIAEAKQLTSDRPRFAQAQNLVATWAEQIERMADLPYLQRAQQFAATETVENLKLAIDQASVIPTSRSIWTEVQTQVIVWRDRIERIEDQPILDRAKQLAEQKKLEEAIVAAAEVQPNRALYPEAQAAITTWKDQILAAEVAKDRAVMDQAWNYASRGQLTDAIATANQINPGRPLYLESQSAIGAWLRERDGNRLDVPAAGDSGGSSESPAADFSADPAQAVEPLTSTEGL